MSPCADTATAAGVPVTAKASATSERRCSSTSRNPWRSHLLRCSRASPRLMSTTVSLSAWSRCQRPISGSSALHGSQSASPNTRTSGTARRVSISSVVVSPTSPRRLKLGAAVPIAKPDATAASPTRGATKPCSISTVSSSSSRRSSRPCWCRSSSPNDHLAAGAGERDQRGADGDELARP